MVVRFLVVVILVVVRYGSFIRCSKEAGGKDQRPSATVLSSYNFAKVMQVNGLLGTFGDALYLHQRPLVSHQRLADAPGLLAAARRTSVRFRAAFLVPPIV